jgi:hypothetical protein
VQRLKRWLARLDAQGPTRGASRPRHSIRRSTWTRIEAGKRSPITFAVFLFTTNSNRVGCSMAGVPGSAPSSVGTGSGGALKQRFGVGGLLQLDRRRA